MMDNLPLRIALLITWSTVAAFMATGAWCAMTRRGVRRGDPMRLACFVTALIFIGYSLRALLAPSSDLAWQSLHLLSMADAGFIIALGHAYGRGPHV